MAATVAAAASALSGCMLLARRHSSNSSHTMHKRIIAGDSTLNNYVASGLRSALDEYSPAWWTNTHIQTFLPFLVPQARIEYTRDIVKLRDGGHAALDWVVEASAPQSRTRTASPLSPDSPIALIMHGLTGGSASMRTLCAAALASGYRPVVFNKRGHGGLALATPKLQAFGAIDDLELALDRVQQLYPSSRLYGIGYSAGAALLCSYLGETADRARIDAGVFISPGYDVVELFCNGRAHRVYDFLMTFNLKKLLLAHRHALRDVVDIPAALRSTSIRAFDERVYVPMHGYADIETYWASNDPMRAVDSIQRPVLCLNALDDPVCTHDTIPHAAFAHNPLAMLIEIGEGSHCAFYEMGGGDNGSVTLESWANKAAMLYLDRVRAFQQRECATSLCNSNATAAAAGVAQR